ncbi:hypothetical protein FA95DRAFT_1137154 [Auriscalpium vulgare]|uniref:Uncharacterized protein n=1 Tax=Auriscalpium vulgare TaxID=40419 RepID=A0ACB8R3Z0_9AGAM|nr:hypothetical protein FA95DRAFT_1137154 [Auriscalpium vulgare]
MNRAVSDFGDASTVVGGRSTAHSKHPAYEKGSDDHHKIASSFEVPHIEAGELTKIEDYFAEQHPFVVKVGKDGLLAALQELDLELRNSGHDSILSKKNPTNWTGSEVNPGYLGFINHGGMPKLLTRPGRYPGALIRNWSGLSQNQAAVVSDPQNHIFIVKNSGFVALGIAGSYDVLGIVDQTHLTGVVKDHVTSAVLGYSQEVTMTASNRNNKQTYVVATFLNIPANNCAILQKGDDLELLPAGQHCITNPNVTLRGLYTLGENQFEMPTKDIYTRDQVPVSLTLYLKWQLTQPLKLATHGYQTPYDALMDKTQSILTQIVAHLDYSSMVKARSIGPDNMEEGADGSSQFLDALRTRAMDDLHIAAMEYGIVLKDLAVIDRQFKGEIASTMDHLTKRALQAQVEAANVDRENSNKVKQEEGTLAVARIKAKARNVCATCPFTFGWLITMLADRG